MQVKSQKWGLRDAFLVILTIVCLILSLNIVLLLIDARSIFLEARHRSFITLVLFLIQEGIFLAPLYFLVINKYRLNWSAFGFRHIGWKQTVKWVLKGFGAVILFNIFFILFEQRFGKILPGFSEQESHIPLFGSNPLDIALATITLVFIAPIIEELLFRGFLLQTFLARFKPWVASLLVAVFFGVIHFEFGSLAIILFLALLLNWIFMRTKSIIPCIAFHMLNNALAFVVEWLVWSGKL